ncbi:MAG: prenyltransferase [Hydromonas sp.]|nr:prenyltransferase [Hydromonas sp.]
MIAPKPRNTPSIKLLLIATRPAFLNVTAVAVLLGYASAVHSGHIMDYPSAALTLIFALVAHAGANVINDYYDTLSGCDNAESERIAPFTGGSQLIQKGRLSASATRLFGYSLLLSVVPVGVYLTYRSGLGLLFIGGIGIFIAWAYSAPPFKLQSRGLGEWAITLSWLLVVIGTDWVQSHRLSFTPMAVGLSFALSVANILYINQFPDIRADQIARKYTLIVRLGTLNARYGYMALTALCAAWLSTMVILGYLPTPALYGLIPLLLQVQACMILWRDAERPHLLAPAIERTIVSTLAHGLCVALALLVK